MISSPVGESAGDNGDEAFSSVTVPVWTCPGTAGTTAEDITNSETAAIAALCRIGRFMIWNNLRSFVVVSREMWLLSDSLDNLQHKTVDAMLEPRKLPEKGRRDVPEDIVVILVVG
jgi:hypothetical protein